MKPRNLLFAISIGLLLFLGCKKGSDRADCARMVDSVAVGLNSRIDSLSMQIQELTKINEDGKVSIRLLRDSLRLFEAESGRLLDKNVFHEPPIRF